MVVTLGWANSVISSGRSPPLYCSTHTLIAMQGHQNNFLTNKNIAVHTTIKIVDDSHIQRIVLATEETTVTQVSHRPNKCQSRSLSQIGTKNNTGHMVGDSPLLKPTGIKIATKPMPGPTNREHRELISVKTMSLGTNYSFYCLECCQHIRIWILHIILQRKKTA